MFLLSSLAALPFPDIDPVAFRLGPFALHWYALAYLFGIILAWRYCLIIIKRYPGPIPALAITDFLAPAIAGIILGGRLGYVLFYNPGYYLAHPLESFAIWQGGMSFHGGLLGVVVALIVYVRLLKLPLLGFTDRIAAAVPIGLFLGRLANFINGELWGRETTVPWAVIFPGAGPSPRHPSQLYEAGLEGLVLFLVLYLFIRRGALARPGLITGLFLLGYGLARTVVEFFREPDPQLGFLSFGTTMGQWLSLPMIAFGVYLIWRGPASFHRFPTKKS